MKILFVNTHFYFPQSHGGMANTLHQLCIGLSERGHEVVVLAGCRNSDDAFWYRTRIQMKMRKTLSGLAAARDNDLSYTVWRAWFPCSVLPQVAAKEQPDVIVAMGGKAVSVVEAARSTEIPILVQVHDVEFDWHGGDFASIVDLPVVANSEFTAAAYTRAFGAKVDVIYPFIPLEKYRVENVGRYVTFINPILRKGLNLGLSIVRQCPGIPFLFVGDVPEVDEEGRPIDPSIFDLPNLTLEPFCSDMREVYTRTRVLLAPSQWEEAYGRVINEAQVSGIPALASTQGGIPEAAAGGAILLPADAPSSTWAKALRNFWNDESSYSELSQKAFESVRRIELNSDYQISQHEEILQRTIEARHINK